MSYPQDHGPQKQPASLRQIAAQQKAIDREMKVIEHGPSPWVEDCIDWDGDLNPFDTRECGYTRIRDANGDLVTSDIDVSTPEGQANARLILAAPYLLEACKAFVECDNQCGANLAFVMAKEAIERAARAVR